MEVTERVAWSVVVYARGSGQVLYYDRPTTNSQHAAAMLAAEKREQHPSCPVAIVRTTEQRAWAEGAAGSKLWP